MIGKKIQPGFTRAACIASRYKRWRWNSALMNADVFNQGDWRDLAKCRSGGIEREQQIRWSTVRLASSRLASPAGVYTPPTRNVMADILDHRGYDTIRIPGLFSATPRDVVFSIKFRVIGATRCRLSGPCTAEIRYSVSGASVFIAERSKRGWWSVPGGPFAPFDIVNGYLYVNLHVAGSTREKGYGVIRSRETIPQTTINIPPKASQINVDWKERESEITGPEVASRDSEDGGPREIKKRATTSAPFGINHAAFKGRGRRTSEDAEEEKRAQGKRTKGGGGGRGRFLGGPCDIKYFRRPLSLRSFSSSIPRTWRLRTQPPKALKGNFTTQTFRSDEKERNKSGEGRQPGGVAKAFVAAWQRRWFERRARGISPPRCFLYRGKSFL